MKIGCNLFNENNEKQVKRPNKETTRKRVIERLVSIQLIFLEFNIFEIF